MLCPKCGKESSNVRVCGFCQTPYPTDASGQPAPRATRSMGTPRSTAAIGAPRSTTSIPAGGDPRIAMARRSRIRSWIVIGVLAVGTGVFWFATRERVIPTGVAIPNLIDRPMSQGEAKAILKNVDGTAQVEVKDGEVNVRLAAPTFPERRDGQLALAQQYARADEILNGSKRAINFLDPAGNRFARADPAKGVVMTR